MTHDGSHWTATVTQIDADGIERVAGVTCFVCDKTWWKHPQPTI